LGKVRQVLFDSLKESAVFAAVAVPVAYVLFLVIHIGVVDSFGFTLLVEACILMLIGGAMDITGTAAVRRFVSVISGGKVSPFAGAGRNVAAAAVFTVTGVILFLASLAVALVLSL
jgi:hypothetical protein